MLMRMAFASFPGAASFAGGVAVTGFIGLAPWSAAAAARTLDAGYFVVIGSFRDDGSMAPHRAIEDVRIKAKRCGLEIFNDYSSKFKGFAPGFLVAVLGPYKGEAEARAVLKSATPCVGGGYIKRGRYLGE